MIGAVRMHPACSCMDAKGIHNGCKGARYYISSIRCTPSINFMSCLAAQAHTSQGCAILYRSYQISIG